MGFGLTGAACLVIPLLVGLLTGHPAGGATVGLGAWLVAARATADPSAVRTPYLLGVVVSVGVGTSLGIVLSGQSWLMVLVASALAGIGGLVRPIGVTPALTLLLTAANPLPMDPLSHTALQLLGGLLSSVLITLPWPWRRARPLVTTLSEAADALAALVEAAADPDLDPREWDALRRKAADALAEAGRAKARYRWQQGSQVVDEVVTALLRAFYEVVALRGLCESLYRRAPDVGDKVGLRELTGSLGRAVREFVAGCPPDGDAPAVDFAARVDVLRAQAPGEQCRGRQCPGEQGPGEQGPGEQGPGEQWPGQQGPGEERDILVLVLLRQIDHCAGRIMEALSGAAEAARRLCSPGIVLPTLAVLPPAADLRPRLAFDNPQVRHALRVVLGTAFASLIIVLYKPPFPHWLVIAVLVTLQPTYGETRAKVWARVAGSTVGGLVTAVILFFGPGHWLLVLFIGVSAALAFGLASAGQAYWATFMTMCVLLLLDFQVTQSAKVAESRVVLTILGGLIAIACARLLWPRGETVRLAERVARMLESHAAAVRALAQVSRGKAPAEKAEELVRKAALDADMVNSSLGYVAHEPGGAAPAAVEQAVEAAQRVRDDLLTVISVLRDEPGDTGPVPEVLEAIADRLEAAAEAVQTGEPYAVMGDVDRRLADDAAWLGTLAERRLQELEADPGDTRTEVRRGLLRTAAVDQALRSLRADAARLCEAATAAFART